MAIESTLVRDLVLLARDQIANAQFAEATDTLTQAVAAQGEYIDGLVEEATLLAARIEAQRGFRTTLGKAKSAVATIAELM